MVDAPRGHLVFDCGKSHYAVPSEVAAEVVGLPKLTRVPGAPAHLLGVFAHRGEVIPVVDIGVLIGREGREQYRRAVLLRVPKGVLALTADKVWGVLPITGGDQPLGSHGAHAHMRGPGISSVGEVAVVDPPSLLEFLSRE